jgi:hypothetical protein
MSKVFDGFYILFESRFSSPLPTPPQDLGFRVGKNVFA